MDKKEFAEAKAQLYIDRMGDKIKGTPVEPFIKATFIAGFSSGVKYALIDEPNNLPPTLPRKPNG